MTCSLSAWPDLLGANYWSSQLVQSAYHISAQFTKVLLDPAITADQDMIGTSFAPGGQHLARQLAKPPSHPVADHGVANLFRDSDTQPDRQVVILPVTYKQNKTGSSKSLPPVGSQKIGALLDYTVTAHVAVG